MESTQSNIELQQQIIKMQTSKAKRRIKTMTNFLEWWHNKVKGQYLTNEQFTNIYNKF